MDMDSLMYRNCDICGEAVSIGRNVCPRCCKEYGTVKFYIQTHSKEISVRDALDRIRKESERSRNKMGGNVQ
jgi:hypothetical protein